jgi:hypothetical protein
MQFRQIGACMQRKYAFIGIQRAIGRANDVIEEGRPMSVNGHETDMPTASRDVRSQGQSGKHLLG